MEFELIISCTTGPDRSRNPSTALVEQMDPDAIEDVYDGELYKKHACPGGFLSNQHNISFLGNTDGVALIRSNGYGVWPVYLVVNEIPPSERCVYSFFLVFL